MEMKKLLQDAMKRSIDNGEVMGVNILVEKAGEEIVYCEEGLADRENNRPICRDTIFRLYSQTKPVTAACEGFWIWELRLRSICLLMQN